MTQMRMNEEDDDQQVNRGGQLEPSNIVSSTDQSEQRSCLQVRKRLELTLEPFCAAWPRRSPARPASRVSVSTRPGFRMRRRISRQQVGGDREDEIIDSMIE